MIRNWFVSTFVLLVCPTELPAADFSANPNIIFILADDLGYGDLGCYGQQLIRTPHLDQMAREGMRFRDFYAGSTVCAPSRCVLMTGKHMGHCHVRGNAGGNMSRQCLRDHDVTVAEVLKAAGYKTALCGKWGLGENTQSDLDNAGLPNKQGFDLFFGYQSQTHASTIILRSCGGMRKRSNCETRSWRLDKPIRSDYSSAVIRPIEWTTAMT